MNICAQGLCSLNHVRLCDPVDYSPPVSSAHGIFQARILKCVAISSSGSSWPRDQIWVSCVSCLGRQMLDYWATWEARNEYLTTPPSPLYKISKYIYISISFTINKPCQRVVGEWQLGGIFFIYALERLFVLEDKVFVIIKNLLLTESMNLIRIFVPTECIKWVVASTFASGLLKICASQTWMCRQIIQRSGWNVVSDSEALEWYFFFFHF